MTENSIIQLDKTCHKTFFTFTTKDEFRVYCTIQFNVTLT